MKTWEKPIFWFAYFMFAFFMNAPMWPTIAQLIISSALFATATLMGLLFMEGRGNKEK